MGENFPILRVETINVTFPAAQRRQPDNLWKMGKRADLSAPLRVVSPIGSEGRGSQNCDGFDSSTIADASGYKIRRETGIWM